MWSRRLAAIFVIVLIVVPLYFGYFSREDQEIRAFRRGYDRGLLDFRFSATLQTLVRPFVAGTRFEDKVNTNAPPIEGHLNIIVADVETIGRPALKCNCAYLGGDIIACDRVFLETFSKSNDFRSVDPAISPTLNQVDAVFEHWLAAWAIGHEIGHAVLHDKDRSFRRLRLHGDSVAQQLESEADRFFASRVPPDDAQKATFALTSFAFSMISATYAIGENQGGAALIRPSRDAVHAPWLIRVIGVAKAVSQTSSSDGSGDSFYDSLLRNVREDPAGVDIGTFCDMSSLRERAEVAMRSRAQARTRHER